MSPLCAAVLPVEIGVVSTPAVGGGVLLAREGADVASVGVGDADVSDLPGDVWPPLAGDGVLLCPEVGDACEEAPPVGVGPPGDEEGVDVLTAAVALPGLCPVGPALGLGGCWEGVAVCRGEGLEGGAVEPTSTLVLEACEETGVKPEAPGRDVSPVCSPVVGVEIGVVSS